MEIKSPFNINELNEDLEKFWEALTPKPLWFEEWLESAKNMDTDDVSETIVKRPTMVVNLFGAPGAGKSTGAALVFAALKLMGVNAELVTEFAKDLTWEENKLPLTNQAYVFGNQYHRLERCRGKVDVIITDSPLPLGIFYNHNPILDYSFDDMVLKVYDSFNNLNFYINRTKEYNPIGRNQTENESDAIAADVKKMLDLYEFSYKEVNGDVDGYLKILEEVITYLNTKEE